MSLNLKYLEQKLLIGSTLVEGSTLTESEAKKILTGKTIQGHPVSEIRELLNYRTATEWFLKQVSQTPYLTKDLLLNFHGKLFQGFLGSYGHWKIHENYTYLSDGSRHDYLHPSKVEITIKKWINDFNNELKKENSPSEKGAMLYYGFEQIHPFEDGNGRIGRILIAYWLYWKTKQYFCFYLKDKVEHIQALQAANKEDLKPLIRFLKKRILK